MAEEYSAICKDCGEPFGYSEASIRSGAVRGLTRAERCPVCRKIHSREGRSIGVPQIRVRPTGPRKPDRDLAPGRLGKILHPERPHKKVTIEAGYGRPDSPIEFGITDDDIRDLIEAMRAHQTTVVVGPTGSGKSTFLPFRLMNPPEGVEPDLFTRYGQIVVTQPRIQATRGIAEFVSRDLHGSSLGAGFDVGFRHSNAPASDWRNKLVYITDGTLINWIVGGQIANLSVIIIDEAHERSLNIDLILGLLKRQLPRFPRLKLIIASATINAALFQNFFGGPGKAALLKFRGLKQHRVDAFFPDYDNKLENISKAPYFMADKIIEILLDIAKGNKSEGDILGFLPGAGPIETCVNSLRRKVMERSALRELGVAIHPLYTRLSREQQDRALARKTHAIRSRIMAVLHGFQPISGDRLMALFLDSKSAEEGAELVRKAMEAESVSGWTITLPKFGETSFSSFPNQIVFTTHAEHRRFQHVDSHHVITDRRVIISTNVAETSLTVDGVVYVVDSGLVKENQWDVDFAANDLPTIFHSRAGCRQRWGRAGRVRDGEAHLLYTDAQFEDDDLFPAYTIPEIQRSSLEQVVLKAKAAGVDRLDAKHFDWIEPPPAAELERTPELLRRMGALDDDGDLTHYGVELESFSTDAPIANLLVTADQYAQGVEMATLAALHQVGVKGGMMLWDESWDFATRYEVEKIRAGLAAPCRDDLEFFFKLYSIWAETGAEKEREHASRLFFLNDEVFANRIEVDRAGFLEMLSIGKKSVEDRPINFALLDRLRMILCVSMPDAHHFRCKRKGGAFIYKDPPGAEIDLEIDEDSTLAGNPPPCFLALHRRVKRTGEGKRRLNVSGLVRLEPGWRSLRTHAPLQLAIEIANILKARGARIDMGADRHRLFLDVRYPVGARFRVQKDADGDMIPGAMVFPPRPLEPAVSDERIDWPEEAFDIPANDLAPLAGWKDHEHARIPQDPETDEIQPKYTDERDEFFEDGAGSEEPEATCAETAKQSPPSEARWIMTDEMEAAGKISPALIWRVRDQNADGCMVISHDYSDPARPALVLMNCSLEASEPGPAGELEPGRRVRVEIVKTLEDARGDKALLVREKKTGSEFIVDPVHLTFSGASCFVDEFADKDQDMVVEQNDGGVLRLSHLPVVEKRIHSFLNSPVEPVRGKIIEQRGSNFFVVLDRESDPLKGCAIGAFFKPKFSSKALYKIGDIHEFSLNPNIGETSQFIPTPPDNLLEYIEKEKFRLRILWNREKKRIHSKTPMRWAVRDRLLTFSKDRYYRKAIRNLYRHSNRITLWTAENRTDVPERAHLKKVQIPESKIGLLIGTRGKTISGIKEKTGCAITCHSDGIVDIKGADAVGVEAAVEMIRTLIPETRLSARRFLEIGTHPGRMERQQAAPSYEPGEIAHGRITRIADNRVMVALKRGGVGSLPLAHLSWKKLLDPREIVHADQEIRVRIVSMNRHNRIHLTMLDVKDSPARKYKKGSVRPAMIYLVANKHALAELEPGIMGVIPRSEVTYREPVEKLREHLRPGQKVMVRVRRVRVDLNDKRTPLKISLSIKRAFSAFVRIPEKRIALLLNKEKGTISRLQRDSGCDVHCNRQGIAKISGPGKRRVDEAVLWIKKRIPGAEIV